MDYLAGNVQLVIAILVINFILSYTDIKIHVFFIFYYK